jgi:hypothetical protein
VPVGETIAYSVIPNVLRTTGAVILAAAMLSAVASCSHSMTSPH